MEENPAADRGLRQPTKRRTVLKAAFGASLILPFADVTAAAKPPHKMRPQANDIVVFRFGESQGKPIKPEHIPLGTEMVQAVTMDPATQIVRDGSRLNGLLLVQLEPRQLTEQTRSYAADGIIAYSSVCNHQGCDLTQWLADSQRFKCYCHYSEFDAKDEGRPMHGPSRRKLALLPLKIEEGVLKAAGSFVGRVGFKRK